VLCSGVGYGYEIFPFLKKLMCLHDSEYAYGSESLRFRLGVMEGHTDRQKMALSIRTDCAIKQISALFVGKLGYSVVLQNVRLRVHLPTHFRGVYIPTPF